MYISRLQVCLVLSLAIVLVGDVVSGADISRALLAEHGRLQVPSRLTPRKAQSSPETDASGSEWPRHVVYIRGRAKHEDDAIPSASGTALFARGGDNADAAAAAAAALSSLSASQATATAGGSSSPASASQAVPTSAISSASSAGSSSLPSSSTLSSSSPAQTSGAESIFSPHNGLFGLAIFLIVACFILVCLTAIAVGKFIVHRNMRSKNASMFSDSLYDHKTKANDAAPPYSRRKSRKEFSHRRYSSSSSESKVVGSDDARWEKRVIGPRDYKVGAKAVNARKHVGDGSSSEGFNSDSGCSDVGMTESKRWSDVIEKPITAATVTRTPAAVPLNNRDALAFCSPAPETRPRPAYPLSLGVGQGPHLRQVRPCSTPVIAVPATVLSAPQAARPYSTAISRPDGGGVANVYTTPARWQQQVSSNAVGGPPRRSGGGRSAGINLPADSPLARHSAMKRESQQGADARVRGGREGASSRPLINPYERNERGGATNAAARMATAAHGAPGAGRRPNPLPALPSSFL